MVEVGQVVYEHFRRIDDKNTYYSLGVVLKKFDQLILYRRKGSQVARSATYDEFKDSLKNDEVGMMILKQNEQPVFAKKTIFGNYKF